MLQKGFIKPCAQLSKRILLFWTLLWAVFSLVIYAFFYLGKEILKISNVQYEAGILLQLTENEQFIYNFFFASVASAFGFIFSSKYILGNMLRVQNWKRKRHFSRTINNGNFSAWNYLLWFVKLGFLLGTMYMMYPFQYDINFIEEFPNLLVLLPIVLFLSSWASLRLALGRKSLKLLFYSFAVFVIMSFTFSFKNFIDVESIIKLLKQDDFTHHKLEIPKSMSYELIDNSLEIIPIFVARNIEKPNEYRISVGDNKNEVSEGRLIAQIIEKANTFDTFYSDKICLKLFIDKSIPMSFVDNMQERLRRNNFLHLIFAVGVENSKYPVSSPLFRNIGVSQQLIPYSAELDSFLQIAENLDFSKHRIRIGESSNYRLWWLKGTIQIRITASETGIFVNNRKMEKAKAIQILKSHIEKHNSNYVVIYSHSAGLNYGKYMELLGSIKYTIHSFREEMARELYNNDYEQLYQTPERQEIINKYPVNIIEWNKEEKKLINLLKKQNGFRKNQFK